MNSKRKLMVIYLTLVIIITGIISLLPAPPQKLEAVGVGPGIRFGDTKPEGPPSIDDGICIAAMGRDDKGVPFMAITGSFSGCQNNTTIYPIGIALNMIIAGVGVGLPYYALTRIIRRT